MKDKPSKTSAKLKNTNALRDIGLLVSVPLLLAALLGAVVYIPQMLASPKTDFVYSSCDTYSCLGTYRVDGGSIVVPSQDIEPDPMMGYEEVGRARLYYYDTSEASSRPLSEEDAKRLSLDDSSRAKDGYELVNESGAGGSIFGGYEASWVLQDGIYRKKVELVEGEPWSNSVRFVGWVD